MYTRCAASDWMRPSHAARPAPLGRWISISVGGGRRESGGWRGGKREVREEREGRDRREERERKEEWEEREGREERVERGSGEGREERVERGSGEGG